MPRLALQQPQANPSRATPVLKVLAIGLVSPIRGTVQEIRDLVPVLYRSSEGYRAAQNRIGLRPLGAFVKPGAIAHQYQLLDFRVFIMMASAFRNRWGPLSGGTGPGTCSNIQCSYFLVQKMSLS